MKKSALIILTIVASLALNSCAVQNTQQSAIPPETLVDMDASDSTYYNIQPVTYSYYYRFRFFDNCYRWFFPRRYYAVIHTPGYVPAHKRTERSAALRQRSSSPVPASKKRGGFGHRGSTHSVVS